MIDNNEPLAPPATLTEPARVLWKQLADELLTAGRFDPTTDAPMLSALCEAIVVHRQAAKEVGEHGVTIETPGGLLRKNPATAVMSNAAATIARCAKAFGMSPQSRGVALATKHQSSLKRFIASRPDARCKSTADDEPAPWLSAG